MADGRISLGMCEGCPRPIFEGDRHYRTVDGCWLCEDHSPMLSDVAKQYREILAAPDFDPGELPFDTPEEMAAMADQIEREVAADGDRSLATT